MKSIIVIGMSTAQLGRIMYKKMSVIRRQEKSVHHKKHEYIYIEREKEKLVYREELDNGH